MTRGGCRRKCLRLRVIARRTVRHRTKPGWRNSSRIWLPRSTRRVWPMRRRSYSCAICGPISSSWRLNAASCAIAARSWKSLVITMSDSSRMRRWAMWYSIALASSGRSTAPPRPCLTSQATCLKAAISSASWSIDAAAPFLPISWRFLRTRVRRRRPLTGRTPAQCVPGSSGSTALDPA